ncbi:MAG: carboxymuconolactone decarboxylase family protein [Acidobacteriota bacterium]
MAFIEYVPAQEWKLDPDNILRIHGVNPGVLRGHLSLYRAIMHAESPLSRAQREMLAVVVSALNGCHY